MQSTTPAAVADATRVAPVAPVGWRRVVTALGLALATIIVAASVRRWGGDVAQGGLTIRPGLLVIATALEVSLLAWNIYLWFRIVRLFDAPAPTFTALVRTWRRSTLAKYLPGSLWSAAATAEMAGRAGASPIALTASFLIQAVLTLVSSVMVGGLFGAASPIADYPVAVASLAVAVLLVRPQSINAVVAFVSARRRIAAPRWTGTWRDGVLLLVVHIATWVAFGVAFDTLLRALTPAADGASWTRLAAINAVAFASGFVAFFAPGGVGVRESVLVVLLTPVVPLLGTRIALAAASRLWLVATEGILGALSFTLVDPPAARVAAAVQPIGATHEDTFAEVFTDSRAALAAIVDQCATARHSIAISQLAFDADCVPIRAPGDSAPTSLLDTLTAAARRGVDVRIVLNGGLLLDTMPALRRALAERGATHVLRLRSIRAFPRMMHAKMIVIDDYDAFLMGASFVNGYWDGATHVAAGDPSAPPGAGLRPLHDISVRVAGAVAGDLARWFDDLWRDATTYDGEDKPIDQSMNGSIDEPGGRAASLVPTRRPVAQPNVSAKILRTAPARRSMIPRTEILDAYLDAIANARSFIYLESQYFSARPIAAAVRAALDATPDLELVLVINQNPDITGYRGWQDARLREHGLLDHPRAGVFSLWSTTPSTDQTRIELTQTFIHSKVAITDDRWATVGSANLDGASLYSYGDDFASSLGRRIFGAYRNYDINVALDDPASAGDGRGMLAETRQALWQRHLGDAIDLERRPADGWLSLWRARSVANVDALRHERAMPSRVLPYVPAASPRDQLAALGVDLRATNLTLRFDPGAAEVVLSAGWMKRLLPERWRPS